MRNMNEKEAKFKHIVGIFEKGYGEDMAKSLITAVRAINFLADRDCDMFTPREAQAVDDILYLFAAIMRDLYNLDLDMNLV